MAAWKRLSTGKYVDLLQFTEDDVDIVDINTSLNYTYRFSGHHKDAVPLTVAQHTVLVANLSRLLFEGDEETYKACIIHDMPEAYYGDITTPVKRIMGSAFYDFTGPIDVAVERVFYGGVIPEEIHERVKVCDLLALDIERRVMWNSQLGKDKWPDTPFDGLTMQKKRQLFLEVDNLYNIKLENYL